METSALAGTPATAPVNAACQTRIAARIIPPVEIAEAAMDTITETACRTRRCNLRDADLSSKYLVP